MQQEVIEICTFIAGDNMTGMFQIWAESKANTMRQLVLIVFTGVENILPSMSTCLQFKPEDIRVVIWRTTDNSLEKLQNNQFCYSIPFLTFSLTLIFYMHLLTRSFYKECMP